MFDHMFHKFSFPMSLARGAPHPCLLVFEGFPCDLGRQYGCVENDEKREANPIETGGRGDTAPPPKALCPVGQTDSVSTKTIGIDRKP